MPLRWDSYSDQPDIIRDKAYKKRIYRSVIWDFCKMLVTNLVIFPIVCVYYLIFPVKKTFFDGQQFFGLGINLDKNPEATQRLVAELGVKNLLIRMPLHDIENIQEYVTFAKQYANKNILINILQDRRHVEDLTLLHQSLAQIFEQFGSITQRFQIGNAINRKKWAIFSMDEYKRVYKVAYTLKEEKYPELILLGSSVIDFEYYFTIRTLFHATYLRYDEFSSLLYVDRRGAPENTQYGLGIVQKLHFLQAMMRLSPKSGNAIVITETNWPIKGTKPYAPTSDTECVNLEDHANYLVRYYLLVVASGVVKNVYWHQLIAAGYGLIDQRGKKLVKYPAYYAYKTMLACLQDMQFVGMQQKKDLYRLYFKNKQRHLDVYWALKPTTLDTKGKKIILCNGREIEKDQVTLDDSPIYLVY
ncbi:MAG: glycosyl hydrolase [Endozoicomonadaceae bacterium]|nr:glycosyl hydrolase [Endozoicomonadaceae bacterium]